MAVVAVVVAVDVADDNSAFVAVVAGRGRRRALLRPGDEGLRLGGNDDDDNDNDDSDSNSENNDNNNDSNKNNDSD